MYSFEWRRTDGAWRESARLSKKSEPPFSLNATHNLLPENAHIVLPDGLPV